jgi:hypothetical protein
MRHFSIENCPTVEHFMKCIYVENHAVFPFTLKEWHHFQNIRIPMASFLNPFEPQIERVWYSERVVNHRFTAVNYLADGPKSLKVAKKI